MRANDKKNIAIVWEGYDAGGVDSYLSYLLDAWPCDDEIYIFYNVENLGVERLKKIISNKTDFMNKISKKYRLNNKHKHKYVRKMKRRSR